LLAAVAACGEGAALSHRTAAAAPNIIRWEDRHPDVIVLGENPPRHPRINGHRTACLPPEHVTTWRGIPITTPERTLLDLAGVLNRDQLRRAIRQSQFLGLTTLGSLVAAPRGPGPSDAFQRALDRERQAILEAHGYRVLRVDLGAGDRSTRQDAASLLGRQGTASGRWFSLTLNN
jgi:hypothetical protein